MEANDDGWHVNVALASDVGGALDDAEQDEGEPDLDQHALPRRQLGVEHRRPERFSFRLRRYPTDDTTWLSCVSYSGRQCCHREMMTKYES